MKTPNKEEILSVYQDAYETGNTDVMKALESLYGQDIFQENITERIKTFGDAYNMLGIRHPLVMSYIEWASPYQASEDCGNCDLALRAFLQLRIIVAALNQGWKPRFTKDEKRYCPEFLVYTKENTDTEGEKNESYIKPIDVENVNASSCLCLKSKELANYCGRQFIDLWADFLLIHK